MKKLSPIDWQSFSLKKDIEIIVKKLQNYNKVQFSLVWEIVIAIYGVALSHIFNDITNQELFWIILIIATVIPFIVFAIIAIINWVNERRKEKDPSIDHSNIREFVESFDNEIAYYILMSESFYGMLMEAMLDNGTKTDRNIIHFYYIQASYYFMKAITDLVPLHCCIGKVLSLDPNKIKSKKIISLPRYINASNLLTTIYEYIYTNKNIMDDLENGALIVKLNKDFKDKLNILNEAVYAYFKNDKK
jgi:hypothetical protein